VTVTFDASNSKDPDGSIATYTWDWDNDGTGDVTYQNPTAERAFAPAGEYKVTLTVQDTNGKTDSVTKTVNVTTNTTNGSSIAPWPFGGQSPNNGLGDGLIPVAAVPALVVPGFVASRRES
jgi:PKD repeat protein